MKPSPIWGEGGAQRREGAHRERETLACTTNTHAEQKRTISAHKIIATIKKTQFTPPPQPEKLARNMYC
jgi:hypothetical protein